MTLASTTLSMTVSRFLNYLELNDRSDRTIAGYTRDLDAFAVWFKQTNGRPPDAASVTPLDAREYRQHLQSVKDRLGNRQSSQQHQGCAPVASRSSLVGPQGDLCFVAGSD